MRRLTKILTVALLVLSLGLHWTLLQTIAWTGMLISYSQDGSLTEAVTKTFDGKHPCCLCKTIKSGQQEEKKQSREKISPDAKIKCIVPMEAAGFYRSVAVDAPRTISTLLPLSRQIEPQTPPPRAV